LNEAQSLSLGDRERLFGWLEGTRQDDPGRARCPADRGLAHAGLDGQKMSKSYGNTITLREDADSITKKIRTMQTDPARVRRTDPGDPGQVPGVAIAPDLLGDDVKPGCKRAVVQPA
jgi:tryptophanyl-tRNA synthetase